MSKPSQPTMYQNCFYHPTFVLTLSAQQVASHLPEESVPCTINEDISTLNVSTDTSSLLRVLTTILPGEPGLASFIEDKDNGSGGDNCSYKTCKAPVKSSPHQTNTQFFTGRMPFLSPNKQCQCNEGKDYCDRL